MKNQYLMYKTISFMFYFSYRNHINRIFEDHHHQCYAILFSILKSLSRKKSAPILYYKIVVEKRGVQFFFLTNFLKSTFKHIPYI